MRTIALLPALVGAFDKPGGGITRTLGGAPSDLSRLTRSNLRPLGTRTVNMVELGNALTGLDDPPIKLLYVYLSNPAVVAPQSREVLAGLAREDLFVVVQEMFPTDTTSYADIVLPGASFLEFITPPHHFFLWPSISPGGGANQLTSQRLTDMGETCAFHCNLVEVQPQGN